MSWWSRVLLSALVATITRPVSGQGVPSFRREPLQAIVDSAVVDGLPASPLLNRIKEAEARGVSTERAAEALRRHVVLMRRARSVLPGASADEMDAGANALRAGAEEAALGEIRRVRAPGTATVALLVLADLVRRGVGSGAAGDAITALGDQRGDQVLLELQRAIGGDASAGANASAALQRAIDRLRRPPREEDALLCCLAGSNALSLGVHRAASAPEYDGAAIQVQGRAGRRWGATSARIAGDVAMGTNTSPRWRGELAAFREVEVLGGRFDARAALGAQRRSIGDAASGDTARAGKDRTALEGTLDFGAGRPLPGGVRVRGSGGVRIWQRYQSGVVQVGTQVVPNSDTLGRGPVEFPIFGERSVRGRAVTVLAGAEAAWKGSAIGVMSTMRGNTRSLQTTFDQRLTPGVSLVARHTVDPAAYAWEAGEPGAARWSVGVRMWRTSAAAPASSARIASRLTATTVETSEGPAIEIVVEAEGARTVEVDGDLTAWIPHALNDAGGSRFVGSFPARRGLVRARYRVDGGPWRAPSGFPVLRDEFGGESAVLLPTSGMPSS